MPSEEEQEERKKKSFEIVLSPRRHSECLDAFLRVSGVSEEFAEMVDLTVVLRARTEAEELFAMEEMEDQEDWLQKLVRVELV